MRAQSKTLSRKSSARKLRSDNRPHLDLLRARPFADLPWLVHGFSTRQGGVTHSYGGKTLNLGLTRDDSNENVSQNRALFTAALGALTANDTPWPLIQARQIHSALVQRVDDSSNHLFAGDGLITNTQGLLLAVKTADCVPVLVVDTRHKAVGAFHAGWRGTAARIVEKGIGEMRRQFSSDPRHLRAAIGPCIRTCCYVVGPEVEAEFESQFRYARELFHEVFNSNSLHVKYPLLFLNQRAPGHGDAASETHLDLVEANRRQLEDAGLASKQIEVIDGCTACDIKRFFSHRAEFGKTGRMMAAIGITPE
jgi:YfiH family protein